VFDPQIGHWTSASIFGISFLVLLAWISFMRLKRLLTFEVLSVALATLERCH
jgi:hypothetical protein